MKTVIGPWAGSRCAAWSIACRRTADGDAEDPPRGPPGRLGPSPPRPPPGLRRARRRPGQRFLGPGLFLPQQLQRFRDVRQEVLPQRLQHLGERRVTEAVEGLVAGPAG